jgi:hypothetical protein
MASSKSLRTTFALSMRVNVGHHQLRSDDKISYLCIDKNELFYHEAFYIGVCRPWRNGSRLTDGKRLDDEGKDQGYWSRLDTRQINLAASSMHQ